MKDEVSHQPYSAFAVCGMGLWLQCCWFKLGWQSLWAEEKRVVGLKKLDYSVHKGNALQLFYIFMTSLKNVYWTLTCSASVLKCGVICNPTGVWEAKQRLNLKGADTSPTSNFLSILRCNITQCYHKLIDHEDHKLIWLAFKNCKTWFYIFIRKIWSTWADNGIYSLDVFYSVYSIF